MHVSFYLGNMTNLPLLSLVNEPCILDRHLTIVIKCLVLDLPPTTKNLIASVLLIL